jgi:hypothetical protein
MQFAAKAGFAHDSRDIRVPYTTNAKYWRRCLTDMPWIIGVFKCRIDAMYVGLSTFKPNIDFFINENNSDRHSDSLHNSRSDGFHDSSGFSLISESELNSHVRLGNGLEEAHADTRPMRRNEFVAPDLDSRAKLVSLVSEHKDLDDTGESQNTRKYPEPPVARRFLVAACFVSTAYFICGLGWKAIDEGRRLVGLGFLGLTLLLGSTGYGLLFLLGERWTWGWLF